MEKLLIPTDNTEDAIKAIDDQISELNNKDIELSNVIDNETRLLDDNDRQRVLLSQVKHINVSDLNKRRIKLTALINQLNEKREEYNKLQYQINDIRIKINEVTIELKTISDAYNQYVNTVAEIDKHDSVNGRYKVIAEATSSTKGKPVLAIRDIVENALSLTNRLLDIMYDGEIELLDPIIDESSFTLPFRCGSHTSSDIRYGSQSESTLLSLALEMSLSASLSQYNVCLIDEIDAYLDPVMHSSYLMMLQETMATLKMEQLFLISHSVQPGQYDHIVHTIDLSKK
jgi:chromosome segregation ATPase